MEEIPQDLLWQTQLIDMTGTEYCMSHNTQHINAIKIVCHVHEGHYGKDDVDEDPEFYDDDDDFDDADADEDKPESVDSVVAHDDDDGADDDDDDEMDEMLEDIGLGLGSSVSGILASAIGAFIYRRVVSY